MKNTFVLALALGVLAGCADETPEVIETDTTIVEPAAPVTEPMDDMMVEDTTMMEDGMMEDGTMMEGDAGLSEDDAMMEGDAMEPMTDETMEVE